MNPITALIDSAMKSPSSLRTEQAIRVSSNDYSAKAKHAEWQAPVHVDSRSLYASAKAAGAEENPITKNRREFKQMAVKAHLEGNGNAAIDAVEQGRRDLENIRKGEQVGS